MTFMDINLILKRKNAYSESKSNLTTFIYNKIRFFFRFHYSLTHNTRRSFPRIVQVIDLIMHPQGKPEMKKVLQPKHNTKVPVLSNV